MFSEYSEYVENSSITYQNHLDASNMPEFDRFGGPGTSSYYGPP